MFKTSHDLWCHHCSHIADNTNVSYEDRLRNSCKTMLIQIKKTPTSLPVMFRHLLDRKQNFTSTATSRSLTSWLNRINLGLERARSGQNSNWFSSSVSSQSSEPSDDEKVFTTTSVTSAEEIIFTSTSVILPLPAENDPIPTVRTVPNLPYVPRLYLEPYSFDPRAKLVTAIP